jgi:hypothetical protein
MSAPKFPTKKSLAKLSKAEIIERLAEYSLEWATIRKYDDEDDPFLVLTPKNAPKHEDLEHALNVGRLHRAPKDAWLDSLTTVKEVMSELRALKVQPSMWEQRVMTLADLKKKLASAILLQ